MPANSAPALPAVETLGSTSVICSDKTGTLTKDEMTVRKLFVAGQMFSVSGVGYSPIGDFSLNDSTLTMPTTELQKLLTAATLASDTRLISETENELGGKWNIQGDPTEGALVVAAAKAGLQKESLDAQYPRAYEIPFSSETKRMTTLHHVDGSLTAYAKGAPEMILDSCNWQLTTDGLKPLDDVGRKHALALAHEMASDALRVLAVSSKANVTLETAQSEMIFLGLAGMIDPPRPEVKRAIEICEQSGIRAVMITGDHPVTAYAVAQELGLLKTGRVVTGAELDAMADEQFQREVETIDVYARVSPAHKCAWLLLCKPMVTL